MRGRIQTLQNEIRNIEQMVDGLSVPMLEQALEELKNMQFEMDMLNRSEQKILANNLLAEEELPAHAHPL